MQKVFALPSLELRQSPNLPYALQKDLSPFDFYTDLGNCCLEVFDCPFFTAAKMAIESDVINQSANMICVHVCVRHPGKAVLLFRPIQLPLVSSLHKQITLMGSYPNL
jgi:hypothetical protein